MYSQIGKLSVVKMSVLRKLISTFSAFPVIIPLAFVKTNVLHYSMEMRRIRVRDCRDSPEVKGLL